MKRRTFAHYCIKCESELEPNDKVERICGLSLVEVKSYLPKAVILQYR